MNGEGEGGALGRGPGSGAHRIAGRCIALRQGGARRGCAEYRAISGVGDRGRHVGAVRTPHLVVRGGDGEGFAGITRSESDGAALAVGGPADRLWVGDTLTAGE